MAKTRTSFKPGQSGNPTGRRPGTGEVARLRALLQPHARALIEKATALALAGDVTALRLCLERLIPPQKTREEPVRIKGLDGREPLVAQGRAVIDALAAGEIAPSAAAGVMQSIAQQARLVELEELEQRISRLEAADEHQKTR